MYQVITRKDTDPVGEFNGLWLNEDKGTLWVWSGKPILVGFSKDGKMVRVSVFNVEFKFTPRMNEQRFEYEFDYDKVPMFVLVDIATDEFSGSELEVHFGSIYGKVKVVDGVFLIRMIDNVELGDLKLRCEPQTGSANVKVYIAHYE